MADTTFHQAAIVAAAGRIGAIMTDMSPFTDLGTDRARLGSFNTALWLEEVVDRRTTAVVEHAERLQVVLARLQVGLETTAADLDAADVTNAAVIRSQTAGIAAVAASAADPATGTGTVAPDGARDA